MKKLRLKRFLSVFTATLFLTAIPFALSTGAQEAGSKTQGVLYSKQQSDGFIKAAGDNAAIKAEQDTAIANIAYYRGKTLDELRDYIVPPTLLPRSLMVWSSGFCPGCEKPVGLYSWVYDNIDRWHFSCPHCKEIYPKNDFGAFYESGLNADGVYDPALADRSLLFNTEHPDPADPLHTAFVDDGTGMKHGDNTWYFIGRAQYSNWHYNVLPAVNGFAQAYFMTGDVEYARRAAVMLDRIADFFPDYDYMEQGLNYEIHQTAGYVTYSIDSAYDIRQLAEAYDMIFDGIKDDAVLADYLKNLSGYAKTDFAAAQDNIERRIFIDALDNPDKIFTNYPNSDITRLTINIVLGWPENREQVLSSLTQIVSDSTLVDGTTGEKGLASYTAGSIRNLTTFIAKLSALDENLLKDLVEAVPAFDKAYQIYFDMRSMGYYPNTDDALYMAMRYGGYPPAALNKTGRPALYSYFYDLYKATGNVNYIRLMYEQNGGTSEGIPYDPGREDAQQIRDEVDEVIKQFGAQYKTASADLKSYRLAMLRAGNGDGDPALWMTYDNEARSHRHTCLFTIGMYYKNLDILPDFGYPPVNMGEGWTNEYVAWYQSIYGHNTAVGSHGYQIAPNENGVTELWVPGKSVQSISAATHQGARTDSMYGAMRSLVLVNLPDGETYALDVFRAKNDEYNEYSLFVSGGWGTMTTEGVQAAETVNVFYGSQIQNLKLDETPGEYWSADFKIDDYFKVNETLTGAAKDIHLRYTGLSKNSKVWTMEAWTEDNYNDANQFWAPRIAVELAPEVEKPAVFAGILEPYETERNIEAINRLEVTDENGDLLPDDYVAVEVLLKSGARDLIFINDDGKYPFDAIPGSNITAEAKATVNEWDVTTDAKLVVVRKTASGKIESVTASKCTALNIGNRDIGTAEQKSGEFMELVFSGNTRKTLLTVVICAAAAAILGVCAVLTIKIIKKGKKKNEQA